MDRLTGEPAASAGFKANILESSPRTRPWSWLNQIEIYFSIVQRKVLTPNDFLSLQALEERLLGFHSITPPLLSLFTT